MKLKELTLITKPFADGQKMAEVQLEYDTEVKAETVKCENFQVEKRTVKEVLVQGKMVFLVMDETEEEAAILMQPKMPHNPHHADHPKEKHGTPLHLPKPQFRKLEVTVSQKGEIEGTDGSVCPGFDKAVSQRVKEVVVDSFIQKDYKGQMYNLFLPEGYEAGGQYPLVVFIPDAGVNGPEIKTPLYQGNGAVSFASPRDQMEHPAIVLAIQYNGETPLTTDEFTVEETDFMRIRKLIDEVSAKYPVDKKRIYLTGQSQGCMASAELMVRYPDDFAAAFLVAGQWNPDTMGKALAHKPFWIVVSESDFKAYPGMSAVADAIEKNGGAIGRFCWPGHIGEEEQKKNVEAAVKEGDTNYFTVLLDNDSGKEAMGHMGTWPVAYGITEIRDWLFTCSL